MTGIILQLGLFYVLIKVMLSSNIPFLNKTHKYLLQNINFISLLKMNYVAS